MTHFIFHQTLTHNSTSPRNWSFMLARAFFNFSSHLSGKTKKARGSFWLLFLYSFSLFILYTLDSALSISRSEGRTVEDDYELKMSLRWILTKTLMKISKSNHRILLSDVFQMKNWQTSLCATAAEWCPRGWKRFETHFSHFRYVSPRREETLSPFPLLRNVKFDLKLEKKKSKFMSLWDGNNCNCKCHSDKPFQLTLFTN